MENPSRTGTIAWTIAAAVSVAACGGETDGESSALATDSEALQRNTDPPDPNDAFLNEGRLTPNTASNDITHTLNPAVCADVTATFLAFSRDTSQRFRTLAFNAGVRSNSWGSYGTRVFSSGPACAMRDPSGTNRRFVLAGKSSEDSRIYTSPGTWNPAFGAGGLPQNPTADSPWAAIDGNTYTVAGAPALTSGPSSMILAVVGNSNRVHVYWHTLPWSGGSWTSRFTSPALPSGVTLVGRPAVEHFPWFVPPAGYFGIAVRATQSGVSKIFVTYFMGDGTGFTGFIPGSTPDWTEWPMPAGTAINGDPAMTSSPALGDAVTLYFRSGSKIKHTSWFLSEGPVGTIFPLSTTSYASSPSANAGVMYEGGGTQIVLTRTSANQLFTAFTLEDAQLIP
jgi:hypothetical protein